MNGTSSHINPQIENAHDQQNKRGWKGLHNPKYLFGKPRRVQVQIADEAEEYCPRKITGQHESHGIYQECEPSNQSALGPK
jgi:hypothetical protein